jgi:O-acetyl-ADP-ribose deacetylase (regulator of RNase III)
MHPAPCGEFGVWRLGGHWSRSAGVGGFPLDEAARIEVDDVRRHLTEGSGIERIVFAVRGAAAREAFERALAASSGG